MSRLPDFFIAGAPKCGTNALYTYLVEHPRIYMPALKEPQYFCRDFPHLAQVSDRAAYRALFAPAVDGALIGEASVWYFFSEVAIGEIMQANPAAKIIMIVRDPIEMAYSLYTQFVRMFKENAEDFEMAWRLQDERRRGRQLPRYCPEPRCLQYRDVCSFGRQLGRAMELVPPEQLKVCIFEEFFAHPREHYQDLISFLGIEPDYRRNFHVANESKAVKRRWVMHLLEVANLLLPGDPVRYRAAARALGIKPVRLISRYNAVPARRPPLLPEFRRAVIEELTPDVRRLETLLGRRLTCWNGFDEAQTAPVDGVVEQGI